MDFFLPLLVIFLCNNLCSGQQFHGSSCTVEKDNSKGTCKYITECPEAMASLKKGNFPQRCGFEGYTVIVCCREAVTTPITTAAPTTTATPTTPAGPVRPVGQISQQKCNDYLQYIWRVEPSPVFFIGAPDIRKKECPFDREQLIVGGTPAQSREFPHMVHIGYDGPQGIAWGCGGSLISELFVITAAHCLEDRTLGFALYAKMGILDDDDEDHLQQFNISQRIFHPEYEEPSHYHDIGLVKLNKEVTFSTWVRPACIKTDYSIPYTKAIASGWGLTDFAGSGSQFLLKVVLELYTQQKCNQTYKTLSGSDKLQNGIMDDVMICAGSSNALKDTCQGDSGGPLQIYKAEEKDEACMYVIVGITSFGKACGLRKDIPGVYTRVSYYVKWIEENVWAVK